MKIDIDETGPITVAHLTGELSSHAAELLTEELHDLVSDEGAELAINLAGVTMIGSSGLAALINVVTRARLCSSRVVMVAPTKFVAGVLNVTKLDGWFDICDSLEEANKRLAGE